VGHRTVRSVQRGRAGAHEPDAPTHRVFTPGPTSAEWPEPPYPAAFFLNLSVLACTLRHFLAMPERNWLQARRAAAQDSTRPTDRLAVTTVFAGALLVIIIALVQAVLHALA
jgi:hypothetical protein